jgi:hypothetical protein
MTILEDFWLDENRWLNEKSEAQRLTVGFLAL